MPDLKKTAGKIAKDVLMNELAKQMQQPIPQPKPRFGRKTKAAGILGVIAAVAGAASQYFGG